jgi:hypothetical protein
MKYYKYILYILLLCITSCDPIFKIRLGDTFDKKIEFDCGYVNITCETFAYTHFKVIQNYNLNEPIYVYPKNIRVIYNGDIIETILYSKNESTPITNNYLVKNNEIMVIDFKRIINKGDTIILNIDNFFECNNVFNNYGDIFLIIK